MTASITTPTQVHPKKFPEGMVPLEKSRFRFACHPEVPCFMVCCRKLTLPLYPYDIIMLKKRLAIHSADFLGRHTLDPGFHRGDDFCNRLHDLHFGPVPQGHLLRSTSVTFERVLFLHLFDAFPPNL